ncbi:MAG: pantetheine-phosphate adenylyltransferase [Bacillota bacterium]
MKAVYPGSFDPVTAGHLDIIERAARIFDRLVVTVFPNPAKAPLFAVEERVAMLREVTRHLPNVEVDSSEGLLVPYVRRVGARVIVKGLRAMSDFDYEFRMALMNKKLDPEVETVFILTSSQYAYLSSSLIKEVASLGGCVTGLVPPVVERRLRELWPVQEPGPGS